MTSVKLLKYITYKKTGCLYSHASNSSSIFKKGLFFFNNQVKEAKKHCILPWDWKVCPSSEVQRNHIQTLSEPVCSLQHPTKRSVAEII